MPAARTNGTPDVRCCLRSSSAAASTETAETTEPSSPASVVIGGGALAPLAASAAAIASAVRDLRRPLPLRLAPSPPALPPLAAAALPAPALPLNRTAPALARLPRGVDFFEPSSRHKQPLTVSNRRQLLPKILKWAPRCALLCDD